MDSKEKETQFNFRLIEYVRNHDVIFNPKNPAYKDQNVKTKCFNEFALQEKLDTLFVNKRWTNLRNR